MVDQLDANIDIDIAETREWLESLEAVIERDGLDRGHFLLESLVEKARRSGAWMPFSPNTAYINSIPPNKEQRNPGDADLEWRIRSIIRWNAMVMVVRANLKSKELGGHIASFASAATLYDVGFNHFWHAPKEGFCGDLIYFQGHSAPGIYARGFLEGRFSEKDLDNFRQEAVGEKGLTSYPHPYLMPDYWQFPTVSMGLGPIMAIYQARFMKYLQNRGLIDAHDAKVWCFIGDGETDEPETLGAISLAGREGLDNLIFVVNCNLQRLDGPVRGNGKIIQELEGDFRGSGWNVLKVIWGSYWDPLFAKDQDGLLLQLMEETVDGEYQAYKAKGGAYTREKFFGKYPKLKEMVATMSDDDIWRLNRGGHDPHKVYAAYHAAVNHKGQPTVILAKTVKGYGMGEAGEGQNTTHQQKMMDDEEILAFRDRFNIPISDEDALKLPYFKPAADSDEMKYLQSRREALGGYLPVRNPTEERLDIPELSAFDALLNDSGDREISTTMAFVRILNTLCRDKNIGKRIVPIVPDESRTFGMEGMFRQLGIYNPKGQLYVPEDSDQLLFYREDKSGQVLQEGINEAGGMSDWIAAATSYANHRLNMVPFFIYYSMFGFQRFGDLAWAAGDMQSRGFLIGGTAGRTTLAGEGLQHQDGHSHILASTIPNCVTYDPTYAYEVAVIVHHGLERMYAKGDNVYYYMTVMNENYTQPAMPKRKGIEKDIINGMYQLDEQKAAKAIAKVQLLGSGTILREVRAAAKLLASDYKIASTIWSVTSFNELAREGRDLARKAMLNPTKAPKKPHVMKCLENAKGPTIACTDYIKSYAEQIREFIPTRYSVLGTDGFGRSDTRKNLREFFEVNAHYIVVATLKALADEGTIDLALVSDAIKRYEIDPTKPNPLYS